MTVRIIILNNWMLNLVRSPDRVTYPNNAGQAVLERIRLWCLVVKIMNLNSPTTGQLLYLTVLR